MTYGELSYRATKLYTKGKITICEYLEMTKPLDREIEKEPKTGYWKIIPSNNNGEYRPNKYACSECGWEIDLCRGLQQDTGHRLFCEHCGADMRGEK